MSEGSREAIGKEGMQRIKNGTGAPSRVSRLGWFILLMTGLLMVLHSVYRILQGPEISTANLAERIAAAPSELQQGSPSAADLVSLTARNFAILEAALGALVLILVWQGFRQCLRWAWMAMWSPVAAIIAMGLNFTLTGGVGAGISYLTVAAGALVGQVLPRPG